MHPELAERLEPTAVMNSRHIAAHDDEVDFLPHDAIAARIATDDDDGIETSVYGIGWSPVTAGRPGTLVPDPS